MEYKLDSEMTELLESPVYAEYYSFAVEFQVSGSFTWDTARRKITEDSYYRDITDDDEGYYCAC